MKNAPLPEAYSSLAAQAPRVRRTHLERREEAEARMIAAAVDIVAGRGLDSLTLAECGEAAGYSRGLAAHYFGTKEALTSAIATHIVADYSCRFSVTHDGRDGLEGLLDAISFYILTGRTHSKQLRAFHAVLGSVISQPALAAAIAELNHASVDMFAMPIRVGIERCEIRSDVDPVAQASLIVASLRGVMTQWLLDPIRVNLDAIRLEYLRGVRRQLAVREEDLRSTSGK